MPNVEKLLGKAISFFVHGSKCRNLVSVPKTCFFMIGQSIRKLHKELNQKIILYMYTLNSTTNFHVQCTSSHKSVQFIINKQKLAFASCPLDWSNTCTTMPRNIYKMNARLRGVDTCSQSYVPCFIRAPPLKGRVANFELITEYLDI